MHRTVLTYKDDSMIVNRSVSTIIPPPIVKLYEMAAPYRSSGDLLDLSQAVPSYGPPPAVLQEVRRCLDDPGVHRYSADPGIPELRDAVAAKLAEFNHVSRQSGDIIITAGANQAFLLTAMTVLNPGDEVILLTPYYFNHHMAVQMVGAKPVEVELDSESGFALDSRKIIDAVTPRTRMIVIVTPSNPTGAIYVEEELGELAKGLEDSDVLIVSDETYDFFSPGPFGRGHVSVGSFPEVADRTFTISSFSKSFGITGWRAGYLAAPSRYIENLLKVQDTMVICAPHISQRVALAGLTRSRDWLRERVGEMGEKIRWLKLYSFTNPALKLVSAGAFFAYVGFYLDCDSFTLAKRLLKDHRVLVIPGEVFGRSQSGYFRIACGGVDIAGLQDAMDRLERIS